MLAGMVLTCSVPLLTYTSITLSLRHALTQPYQNDVVVTSTITPSVSGDMTAISSQLATTMQTTLAPFAMPQSALALRSADFPLVGLPHGAQAGMMHFKAFPPAYLAQQFPLLQGSFLIDSETNDILLTQQTAVALAAQVGSTLSFLTTVAPYTPAMRLTVRVAGIVTMAPDDIQDPLNIETADPLQVGNQTTYAALLLNSTFLRLFDTPALGSTIQVTWMYAIAADRVTEQNFEDAQAQLQSLALHVSRVFFSLRATNTTVYGNALFLLQSYDQRIQNTETPLTVLLMQLLMVVIGFIVTSTTLLIERLTTTLALLRSRGARAWQVAVALMMPCIGLGLISVAVGPLLAVVVTGMVVTLFTSTAQATPVVMPLFGQLAQVYGELKWYSVGLIIILLFTLGATLWRTMNLTMRSLRQEEARLTRPAFWQRASLDVMAALVALSFSLLYVWYLAADATPETYATLAPYAIYAPFLLIVAAMALSMRVLPWFVRLWVPFAARSRGIVLLLASIQLAQSRRTMQQVTLFLALAITCGTFTLTYQTSQYQHDLDYAAFQVGADFSGTLPIRTSEVISYQQQEAIFQQMPGVTGASLGAIIDIHAGLAMTQTPPVRLIAVDSATFGQVGTWPNQTGSTLVQAMQTLHAQRDRVIAQGAVPVIVDDALWQEEHLAPGFVFTRDLSGNGSLTLRFVVLGHVAHLPMTPDLVGYTTSNITGGMIADFPTLVAAIQEHYPTQSAPPGYIWLKTAHDATTLHHVRTLLQQAPYLVTGIQDRYRILADRRLDPLAIALTAITTLGACMALLLALIIAAQVLRNAGQKRQLPMTVLLALGARRRQMRSMLLLEDGMLLLIAGILGVAFGVTLAGLIVPLITFAQGSDLQQPFITLLVPPAQVVVPLPLILTSVSVFLGVCALLGLGRLRPLLRSAMGAILRLNED
jgi:hypothetical protein